MLTAAQARRTVQDWKDAATKRNNLAQKKFMEEERRETEKMWPTKGLEWVQTIEGYIEKAAAKGRSHTYEPTTTNPNGDMIICIGEENKPIYKKLMQHFRDKGFTVEEYAYYGMKITW